LANSIGKEGEGGRGGRGRGRGGGETQPPLLGTLIYEDVKLEK